jgi:2-methylcitrate dehydratase PrpD
MRNWIELTPICVAPSSRFTTSAGARRARDVTHPKGSPENPLTCAELGQKFDTLTGDVLAPDRREDVARAVNRLEELREIAELTELLGPSAVGR